MKKVAYPPVPLGLLPGRLAICESSQNPPRSTVMANQSAVLTTVTVPSIGSLSSVVQPNSTGPSTASQQQVDAMMRRLESLMRSMEIFKTNQREERATLDIVVKSTRPAEFDKTQNRVCSPNESDSRHGCHRQHLKDELFRMRWVIIFSINFKILKIFLMSIFLIVCDTGLEILSDTIRLSGPEPQITRLPQC